MEIRSKLVVLGMVKNQKDEFLISQRYEPSLPEVHLKWDLPGGTHELGEKLEETLAREFIEETGLEIVVKHFLPKTIAKTWDYPNHRQHTLVLCFLCELIKGDLSNNDHKINDLRWVPKEKLLEFDFLSTTKSFVDMILEDDILTA